MPLCEIIAATQPAVWREMVRRWPRLGRLCVDEGLERLMRERPRVA